MDDPTHRPSPAARDVSCRPVSVFLDAAEQQGLEPTALTHGLPYSDAHLRSRRQWIDWESWARFLERAGALWSDEELEAIGRSMIPARQFRGLASIANLLASPADFMVWMTRFGGAGAKRVFACLDSTVHEISADEIEIVQTLREGCRDVREFWISASGALQAVPLLFGHPPARVELERIRGGARYRIRYVARDAVRRPRAGGWLSRLRPRWAAAELKQAYEELQQRCAELDAEIAVRKRAEQENARWAARVENAQRLESLGLLAGGIAHDFNNILVGIQSNAELMAEMLPEGSEPASMAQEILICSNRASDLTRQLLAYAGRAQVTTERAELGALVDETLALLRNGVAQGARLEHSRTREPIWIEADATQIRQVLMNLVTNGVESVSGARAVVELRTGTVEAADHGFFASFRGDGSLEPGVYAYVAVSDNGAGMSEDVSARIFEPFYTNKARGRGLGLAATLGILRAHGGGIAVESEPGAGTTFRLVLPRSHPAPVKRRAHAEGPLQGKGRLLLVDDEVAVERVVAKILRGFGFEVLTASSGESAVRLLQREPEPLRACVLDWSMPGMDGRATLSALREIRPDLPVLFYSGYAEQEIAAPVSASSVRFLQKPFTRSELASKLKELLPD
jgi:signal transduction histidine kinase